MYVCMYIYIYIGSRRTFKVKKEWCQQKDTWEGSSVELVLLAPQWTCLVVLSGPLKCRKWVVYAATTGVYY